MVEYHHLVKKPQVSAWICVSRRHKILVSYMLLGVLIGLIIVVAKRNASLANIYKLQASIGNMLDLELRYLPKANQSDGWRETSVTKGHIFSAYLDTRPEQILEEWHSVNENETTWAMIRIIAILDTNMTDMGLTCVYKYKGKKSNEDADSFILTRRTATRVKPVAESESFGLRYAAFFVLCDLTVSKGTNYEQFYNNEHLPYEITIAPIDIVDFSQVKNESFVSIRYSENGISMAEYSNRFMGVCVKIFHHNYDKVLNLVEFIEFYKLMGADHFTFYNRSISSLVSKVLDHYISNGLVTVLPWELPSYFIYEKTIRVDGMFAALNDCLYRSSFHKSHKYVAAVDVDEFIVPRIHNDYFSMMEYLDPTVPKQPPNNQASFLFRNMFFYSMFDDDPITLPPDMPRLNTHSKTMRWTKANPAPERSKLIVRSRQTVELGNHHTWEMRRTSSAFGQRYKEVVVDLGVGASQHYRNGCETNEETCWQRRIVRDRNVHRFTKELGRRVAVTCKEIFKEGCPTEKKIVDHPNGLMRKK